MPVPQSQSGLLGRSVVRRLIILGGLISGLLAGAASAQTTQPAGPRAEPRFLRSDSAGVQTSISSYRHPSGVTVDLIATIHVGSPDYYEAIDTRLRGYDVVLYEYVGRPGPRRRGDSTVGPVRQAHHITYHASNMLQADLDSADFARLARPLPGGADASSQSPFHDLPDVEDAALLARLDPYFLYDRRNDLVIDTLTHRLARGDGRIAILYGAAHMPGLDLRLRQRLGFARQPQLTWLTAWNTAIAPSR